MISLVTRKKQFLIFRQSLGGHNLQMERRKRKRIIYLRSAPLITSHGVGVGSIRGFTNFCPFFLKARNFLINVRFGRGLVGLCGALIEVYLFQVQN